MSLEGEAESMTRGRGDLWEGGMCRRGYEGLKGQWRGCWESKRVDHFEARGVGEAKAGLMSPMAKAQHWKKRVVNYLARPKVSLT